jgi:GntR family transcriptional regulator
MRYLEVAQQIRESVAAGRFGAGGVLDSETDLARRFGVSRMTLRRALEALQAEGLLKARKGSGWFVSVDPVRQALGRFDTIEATLAEQGVTWERRVLEFRFEKTGPEVAAALELEPGDEVLLVRRLNLADSEPFALVTVWVPAPLGAELSRADVEATTFYDLLPRHGTELAQALQTITAAAATEQDAQLLEVPAGSPLLVCRRLTRDVEGAPAILGEHRYAAHRTLFEVEFTTVTASAGAAPSGLRLVSEGAVS